MRNKSLLLFVFCLLSSATFSQDKPEIINSSDKIKKGVEYYEDGKYELALKEYSQIPENDTNYYIAVVEQALTYYQLEKYEEGIAMGKKALGMDLYLSPELYTDMGCCYDNLQKYGDAVALYEAGSKLFPKANMLYFNKAFSLTKLEKNKEAFECYKKSEALNPFHPGTHYALGILAMNEGKTSLALLAFSTYILLDPDSKMANNALLCINEMVTTKYEESVHPKGLDITDGDDFSEIDILIKNYVALNKKYKVPSKLNFSFIKQDYLLFDKLPDDPETKGFWYKTYVPFYKQLLKDNKFDLFATYLLQASANEAHKKIVEKNKSRLSGFVEWFKNAWDNQHRQYDMEFNGKLQKVDVFRANKRFAISSFGVLNSAKTDYLGYTEFYHANGKLKAKGIFVEDGKKDGEWIWYHENGNLKTKATYVKGELISYDSYSLLGIIESHIPYKSDKIDGEGIAYSNEGAKDKTISFKNDIRDGIYEEYYSNGQVYFTGTNKNGKLDGPVKTYYSSGELMSEVNYLEGKKNLSETLYFRNGKIRQKANYVKGVLQGDFISYYENGQVSDSIKYLNDKPVGKNILFFENGVVSVTADFDETGKLNGVRKEYDTDGKIYNEREYRKGEIISYKYYNKKGQVVKEDKKKSGTFDFESFYSTGMKSSSGVYGKEDKQGEWKFYDKNGNIESISRFVDGKSVGEAKSFFTNGKIEKILHYKDDLADGYYVEYYKNGNINSHGNYLKDDVEGYWATYNPDKSLAGENFYIEGQKNGIQRKYSITGKIFETETFYKGVLLSSMNYDSLGNVIDSIGYTNASGLKSYHFYKGGPVKSEINIQYGNFNGDYVFYFPNGKINVKGQFFNGYKNGKWTWYYWNGNVSTTGNYKYGDTDGKWEYYTEDGKLDRIVNYRNGKRNGKDISYYENGKPEYDCEFIDGLLEGVSLYYSPDGQLEHKRLFLHDQLLSYTYFDASGKEKTTEVDNETAEITIYLKNGKIARQYTVNKGLYQGPYKRYYSTGQLYEISNYKDDDVSGENIYYYPNGQVKEKRNYVDGEPDGYILQYYPDGKLKESVNYISGTTHGKCRKYDKNGKLIAVLTYYNDEVVGISDK